MNRPPPPGPEQPWYLRRPPAGDPTGMARPVVPQPRPPLDPQRPPARRPAPPPEIPWYQRPVPRPAPATPAPPPPARDGTATRDRRLLWSVIGVSGVAAIALTALLVGGTGQFGGGRVLDVAAVQAGVARILSDPAGGYGANTVADVSCNQGRNPSARKGTTFDCQLTVNGAARQVSVLVSDDAGTYEVDRPR